MSGQGPVEMVGVRGRVVHAARFSSVRLDRRHCYFRHFTRQRRRVRRRFCRTGYSD
ncbi:hypothetical protein XHV734_3403 [Xanthomonas hortorum pv. vitians]|nr:hypothetical protein XHV734_3403 [Xanthomonas hortorum pv. vitians]